MCLTNIDIVDGIDCLQVLQHADGSEKYLTVPTDGTCWEIGSTNAMQSNGGWIFSASAGDGCPASSANKKSDRNQRTSWRYYDGKAWLPGDVRVKCFSHNVNKTNIVGFIKRNF